jgi:hypothetical protein
MPPRYGVASRFILSRPTAFSDPPTQCGNPSPLMPTITPDVTGGDAPLRRRLTTREAMARPVELPLEASVQHRAVASDDEAAEHRAVDDLF